MTCKILPTPGEPDIGNIGDIPPIFAQAAQAKLTYFAQEAPSPSAQAIVVRKDSPIQQLVELKGKKIAVEKGTAAHKYVTEHCKDSEIVVFPAISAAFMEVEQGKADALMQDKPNAVYYLKKHPESGLALLGDETAKIPDGFALPKDSPYKAEFDKALKELQEDGTIKKLEDKWLNV